MHLVTRGTKVLLISHRPEHSGKGVYAHALKEALAQRPNLRVTLHTKHSQRLDNSLNRIIRVPPAIKVLELLSALNQFSSMLTIPNCYDVYHVTSEVLALFTRSRKPSVVTVHDVLAYTDSVTYGRTSSRLYQLIYQQVRFANKVICVSDQAKSDLMKFLGKRISSSVVRVIYPGVDHTLFRPRSKESARKLLGLPQRSRIVLHVGTEEPRKNLPTLLSAFAQVRRKLPDVILVRVGIPTGGARDLITAEGIGRHVTYLKPSSELLPHVYNAADLFVLPSLQEGFGFPLLEAMASGCPIVASNQGPIVPTLSDTGLLTSPLDIMSLANSILRLLENDGLRDDLAKRAFDRSQLFSWERCAKETAAVYEEISSE